MARSNNPKSPKPNGSHFGFAAVRAQVEGNVEQFRTLAVWREALLPNLLSGELRLPDAEEVVASTAFVR